MSFRFGQTILFILCVLVAGFLDFYLGARFGPEMFWGISLDRTGTASILPTHIPDLEIEKMLAEEESHTNLVFDEALKRKGEVPRAMVATEAPEITVPTLLKQEPKTQPVVEKSELIPAKIVEVKAAEKKPAPKEELKVRKEPESVALVQKPIVKELITPIETTPKPQPAAEQTQGSYTLQLGSFSEKTKALSMLEKYKASGLPAVLGQSEIPQKGTWYRVYVGHYSSAEEAESAKQKILSAHQVVATVVRSVSR